MVIDPTGTTIYDPGSRRDEYTVLTPLATPAVLVSDKNGDTSSAARSTFPDTQQRQVVGLRLPTESVPRPREHRINRRRFA